MDARPIERLGVAASLIALATWLVADGRMSGDAWATYTEWVLGFVLAHHAITTAGDRKVT